MIKNKKFIWVASFVFIATISFAYAADTIIQRINGAQTSSGPSAYISQQIQTIWNGDLTFINYNNDTTVVGDYFTWEYYDAAYWVFTINSSTAQRLKVASLNNTACLNNTTYQWYSLQGFAYNREFWNIDFAAPWTPGSYLCIPKDSTNKSLKSYLWWYAYSSYIGYQNFDNISLDVSIDLDDTTQLADGWFVKVEWNVSTKNENEAIDDQFEDNIRVIGNLTKATFRSDIQKKVFSSIKWLSPTITSGATVVGIGNPSWTSWGGAISLLNNTALYYKSSGGNIEIGTWSVVWTKTLIVEGWNVFIRWNITGNGTLGIIALQNGTNGGNIYIHPGVTDIHAVIYSDKSVISYDGSTELSGTTPDATLANQLYIYGSIFSENTLWGGVGPTYTCPYYISTWCTNDVAKKYDLNFIRRYKLVSEIDTNWNIVSASPQYSWSEAMMWDNIRSNTATQKPGYQRYPFVIEYNPLVQRSPPPFFE